jgi:hypothetical protein
MRWQDVRQLASMIEAEAEGRFIDRALAAVLAKRVARKHPHISASMTMIMRRMGEAARVDRP